MAKHFIKKQIIEVNVPSQKEADAIQERIISIYNKKVLPVLDQLFTDLSDDDQLIEIDRLEIDLGSLNLDDLEKSLVEQVYTKVSEKLNDAILLTKVRELRKSNEMYFDDLEVSIGHSKSEGLRNIIHFFKTGLFHWRDETREEKQETIKSRTEWWIKEKPVQLIEYLKPLLIFESVIERIFYQTTRLFIKELIFNLKDQKSKAILIGYWLKERNIEVIVNGESTTFKSLRLVKEEIRKQSSEREFLELLDTYNEKEWRKLTEEVEYSRKVNHELNIEDENLNQNELRKSEEELKKLPLREQFLEAYEEYKRLKKSSSKEIETEELKDNLLKSIEEYKTDKPNKDEKIETVINEMKNNLSLQEIEENKKTKQKNKELKEEKMKEQKHVNKSEPIDEVYLKHAGILLLWPYFSPFFNGIGLLDGKEFKNLEEQKRATLILHYLATGEEEVEEPDLALNKILCGLEIDDPVPSKLILTETERAECENLLKAILANWETMKTYSIEALQETFLQREGVLTTKNVKGLHVIVQRTGVDLLLDSLPWSISLVRLPWLEINVFVEW